MNRDELIEGHPPYWNAADGGLNCLGCVGRRGRESSFPNWLAFVDHLLDLPEVRGIRMAAWNEGYWARGHDEEYDTDTECPFGPFDLEAFTRANYSRDEVDLIASVEDWASATNRESLREAQRQQTASFGARLMRESFARSQAQMKDEPDPHKRHPHAADGECMHGYAEKRYITQDYYSGEPL